MDNEQEKDVSVINRTPDYIKNMNEVREKVLNFSKETSASIKRNIISCKEFNESGSIDYITKSNKSNLIDILEKHKFIVLLGDAGEGKSIFLKSSAYDIMNNDSSNKYLALYYSLNMYSDEDILLLLEKEYGDFSKFKDLKFIFLFDEFDQAQNKALLTKKIQSFRERYNDSLFCIASRSNSYSNNFNNAELVQLLPFSSYNVEQLAKIRLPLNFNSFLNDIKVLNYSEFIRNPFNLNIIIDFYKVNNHLPKNKAEIINEVIRGSINEKLSEVEEDILFKESYELETVYFYLQKISLVMESLQTNFLTNKQLIEIVPNKEIRHVIKKLSIIKKSFFNNIISFQFVHNNYNEYLAADALKNKSIEDILQLITISGLPEYNIIPQWKNTISFLLFLRENQDLIEYLIKIDPTMLLDLEVGRLTTQQGNLVFRTLYEKYSLRNIWLDIDPVNLGKMALNNETYNYLKNIIKNASSHMNKYNAVYIIRYFKKYAENELKNALISLVLKKDIETGLRTASLATLVNLYEVDKKLVDTILPLLQERENVNLVGSFFSFLNQSPTVDSYVENIIEHIPLIRFNSESEIFLSKYAIVDCIEKLQTEEAIKKLLDYFIENIEELNDIYIDELLSNIVNKALDHQKSKIVWNQMRELLKKSCSIFAHKAMYKFLSFFVASNTLNQLFYSFYKHMNVKDSNYYTMLALSITEENLQKLISDKKEGKLSEEEIMSVINALNTYQREVDFKEKLVQDLNIELPFPINYEEIRNKELLERIEIIFSKEKYLSEIKKVFIGEGKEKLSVDDLEFDKMWDSLKSQQKYSDYVLNNLRKTLGNQPIKFEELEASIDYDFFTLYEAYEVKINNSKVEFSKEQREKISQLCYKKIHSFDFNQAITYKEDGFSISSISLPLWFFNRLFNLRYSENILLDMLSFDFLIKDSYVGIKYIEENVSLSLIQERILTNLNNKDIRGQILINHLNFCKEYKVMDSIESIKKLLINSELTKSDKLACVKTLMYLDIDLLFLKELMLSTDDGEIFDICAIYLMQHELQGIQDVLIKALEKKKI